MQLQFESSALGLSLRPAVTADDVFFQQLFAANHAYFAQSGLPEHVLQQLLQQQYQLQQQSYQQQNPDIYLLQHQQQAVGRLILARQKDALHLTDLALLPGYCGLGLGGELMQALQQYARQQHLALTLLVEQQNKRAQKFYLRHDFTFVAQVGSHNQLCWQYIDVSDSVSG